MFERQGTKRLLIWTFVVLGVTSIIFVALLLFTKDISIAQAIIGMEFGTALIIFPIAYHSVSVRSGKGSSVIKKKVGEGVPSLDS